MDPRVAQAMRPFFEGAFGNPSSLHRAGRIAKQALDLARRQTADLLHADAKEIIFTSGGTEADNMALFGISDALHHDLHIITSPIEHPAVTNAVKHLQLLGAEITFLPVGSDGIIDPAELAKNMRPTTRLVSIMAANNVVGTIQPIAELGRIAREHGAWFHTDAVQAFGKIPLDMRSLPVDLLSLSAHKLHGPKGIGALYVRKGIPLNPIVRGGGQESGFRSGTENVAGIVGLGQAAEIAGAEMSGEATRLVGLRDRIIDKVAEALPNSYLIGDRYKRLPGHICLGFRGWEGKAIKMLLAMDDAGIEISSGSACSSSHVSEPSQILLAMGFDPIRARGSMRITLGRFNTEAEADRFLTILPTVLSAAMR